MSNEIERSERKVIPFPSTHEIGRLVFSPSPQLDERIRSFLKPSVQEEMADTALVLYSNFNEPVSSRLRNLDFPKADLRPTPMPELQNYINQHGHHPRALSRMVRYTVNPDQTMHKVQLAVRAEENLQRILKGTGYIDGANIPVYTGFLDTDLPPLDSGRRELAKSQLTRFVLGEGAHPSLGTRFDEPSTTENAKVTNMDYLVKTVRR